jgi:dihydroorotase
VRPILISGGRVIDPAHRIHGDFDVLISDGEIKALERPGVLGATADAVPIDASGCWVVPGLIDPHVHLRDPGFPQKETIGSGLRAAAAGGFTAVAAMANTAPVDDTPEIARYMLDQSERAHAARLVPVSAVTKGLLGRTLVDYPAMAAAGARLFSDDGIPVDDEAVLARALDQTSRLGFAVSLHEEDRALSAGGAISEGAVARCLGVAGIPARAETERIRRDLALATRVGAAVHVAHVSTAESLDLIRTARSNGAKVTCEVTPHHLMLDDHAVLSWGPNAKMSPPLRHTEDIAALVAGLADGTIDMIATDHAPHDFESKQMANLAGFFGPGIEAPQPLPDAQAGAMTLAANGVIGLETALGLALRLVHRGMLSSTRLVELMALNPARLLRLESGTIAAGSAADVTVIDPNLVWQVDPTKFLSKSRNCPFAGMELKGKAILTMVAGAIVYDGRTAGRS